MSHPAFVIAFIPLIVSAGCAAISIACFIVQEIREARRGYTTAPNMYPKLEWRDPKTGLVLRKAGDPTPPGSLAELRKQALENEAS